MANRPDKFPSWATDTNYTSGPDNGTVTKLEPISGALAQGFQRGKRAPAKWMNWLLGKNADWLAYLDEQLDSAMSASMLCEQKGTISAIWASNTTLAWCGHANAFATIGSGNTLDFVSGANALLNDAVAAPAMSGTVSGWTLVSNGTDKLALLRASTTSTANRFTVWTKSGFDNDLGAWTTPTGIPNGTALMSAVHVTGATFLAFDGTAVYEVAGGTGTAKTAVTEAPQYMASNGTVTVICNDAGSTTSMQVTANNGASWTTTSPGSHYGPVVWFPRLSKFVMIGTNFSFPRCHHSSDGITWSDETATKYHFQAGDYTCNFKSLSVANNGRMLVAVGSGSGTSGPHGDARVLLYSFDGVNWYAWDFRAGSGLDTPAQVVCGRGQVAVRYAAAGGAIRLFGAG